MKFKLKNTILELKKGDITEMETTAIVNPANKYLKHGGGVAKAIVEKGGEIIQKESDKIGFCPVGEAVITTGGKLKAKYVIHTVGPKWGEGKEKEKLKKSVLSCLKLADKKKIKSLSLPAISTGIFGFPKEKAAKIILETISDYVLKEKTNLEKIIVCLYDTPTFEIFKKEFVKIVEKLT